MAAPDIDWIDEFYRHIRPLIFVRRQDSLLIIVPNQAYRLNATAIAVLERMAEGKRIGEVMIDLGDGDGRRQEVHDFFCDLRAALMGCLREGADRRAVERVPYALPFNALPVLSEIAVTYRCNLACRFCYAGCTCRKGPDGREMTTDQVKRVLEIIRRDAQVPSVSFTGGEPTLRDDLPDLVAHARSLEMRVNLITNGTRLTPDRVAALAEAGLNSAQVSVESASPAQHDWLTQQPGSWDKTMAGIEHLKHAGITCHTNTTLTALTAPTAPDLVTLADGLGLTRLSMNMIIPTGSADAAHRDLWLFYRDIGPIVEAVRKRARSMGIEFLWYSPTPYCLYNPVAHGLGNKGCAACDGLLSVSPTGEVFPCSSLPVSVGNLLKKGFRRVWTGRRARYWREKRFAHPKCRACDKFDLCTGACPIYWDAIGCEELLAATPLSDHDGRAPAAQAVCETAHHRS